jgi:hypothetical protein
VVAGIAATWWIGRAIADDAGVAPVDAPPSPLTLAIAAGRHLRLDGPHGAIHVWVPPGYHPDGAATVVYVHGYYTDIDGAWTGHQLPEQFAMSAINALFIAPEAPNGSRQGIQYPDLGELVRYVEAKAGVVRGAGPLVVIGHSGGYRTLERWLDEPTLEEVILVDALYAELEPFELWYGQSPRHRMVNVADDTVLWTEELARNHPETVTIDRFPPGFGMWPEEARRARHVYVRSQFAHMPLVMGGVALPLLLRLLPVALLPEAPWRHRLGDLPPLPADAGVGDGGAPG